VRPGQALVVDTAGCCGYPASVWPERNTMPLSPAQIEYCEQAWAVIIDSELPIPLDISRAAVASTLTGYSERDRTVYLGTNAFPNAQAATANARLSVLACLAHEYGHAQRHALGILRPNTLPDLLLDEAETSIHASFHPVVRPIDREDLVEDARDRLTTWLAYVTAPHTDEA
jgi:hypothetical protein